jgi:hypothetical protein
VPRPTGLGGQRLRPSRIEPVSGIYTWCVNFRITRHSGWEAPDDALDMLWERLKDRRDEAYFAKGSAEIRASWGSDAPSSIDRDEREEFGRMAILEILRDVCGQEPELRSDWFAVGPYR